MVMSKAALSKMARMLEAPGTWIRFLVFAGVIFMLPSGVESMNPDHPFAPGEKLTYGIKWSGIPVGEGALEVVSLGALNGLKAYRFEMRVESYPVIDVIYKVRDTFSSYAAQDLKKSLHFRKIQDEGGAKRDVVVRFDWENNQASYSNHGKEKPPVALVPGALDPLSALYFVRTLELGDASEFRVPVTDGKNCVVGKARIVGRQTVEIDGGSFETYLLESNTEKVGGIFEKTANRTFRVWITADARKIPVKAEVDLTVGMVTAELISYLDGASAEF